MVCSKKSAEKDEVTKTAAEQTLEKKKASVKKSLRKRMDKEAKAPETKNEELVATASTKIQVTSKAKAKKAVARTKKTEKQVRKKTPPKKVMEPTNGEAKRGVGRPSLGEDVRMMTIRITSRDWDVFKEILYKKNMTPSKAIRGFIERVNEKHGGNDSKTTARNTGHGKSVKSKKCGPRTRKSSDK